MRPARRSRANDAVENTTAAATAVVGAPTMAEVSEVHKQLAASNIDTVLARGSKDLGTAVKISGVAKSTAGHGDDEIAIMRLRTRLR